VCQALQKVCQLLGSDLVMRDAPWKDDVESVQKWREALQMLSWFFQTQCEHLDRDLREGDLVLQTLRSLSQNSAPLVQPSFQVQVDGRQPNDSPERVRLPSNMSPDEALAVTLMLRFLLILPAFLGYFGVVFRRFDLSRLFRAMQSEQHMVELLDAKESASVFHYNSMVSAGLGMRMVLVTLHWAASIEVVNDVLKEQHDTSYDRLAYRNLPAAAKEKLGKSPLAHGMTEAFAGENGFGYFLHRFIVRFVSFIFS